MALAFPLSRNKFLGALPIQDDVFTCPAGTQHNNLGGGEVLKSEVAPPLWNGRISLAPMKARPAAEVLGLLEALALPGRAFKAFRPNQHGPAADPLGAAISGFSPVIDTVDYNAATLRLSGLPAGYVLTAGDFLSFSYGTSPVRQALHRVLETVTADGAGLSPAFQVHPHIRPGAPVGGAVTLVRPWCKAVLVPGSVNPGSTAGNLTSGIEFSFRQSLR